MLELLYLSALIKEKLLLHGNYIGGIAGIAREKVMSDCYNVGDLLCSESDYVGGLLGRRRSKRKL